MENGKQKLMYEIDSKVKNSSPGSFHKGGSVLRVTKDKSTLEMLDNGEKKFEIRISYKEGSNNVAKITCDGKDTTLKQLKRLALCVINTFI